MRRYLMTAVLAVTLLSGLPVFGAQISIGIRIGPPPPSRVLRVRPVQPSPDFIWVQGYWYPVGSHWRWHEGYWTIAPYAGARWLAPRYEGGEFFQGYWEGEHGRVEHDHAWDKHRERDHWEHDRGHGHGHDHDHEGDHDRGHDR